MAPQLLLGFNQLLEAYYLEHTVLHDTVSLAIERYEIKKLLEPTGYTFEYFCKLVSSHWREAVIVSSVGGEQFIAAAALQVAAGFKSDEVDLPTDARYTDFLFELLGCEGDSGGRNAYFYGLAKENSKRQHPGTSKQDYLWKAVRSHFSRKWGLKLYLPPERLGRDRFIQYPKSHLLFREAELKAFAESIEASGRYDDHLQASLVTAHAFRTWASIGKHFPPSAKNRIYHEQVEEKYPLYEAQAARYLVRRAERRLEREIAEGESAKTSQLRHLRAKRAGFDPYFLEEDGDGGYELFRDFTFDFIEPGDWASAFPPDETSMLFCADPEQDNDALHYLGPKPRPTYANSLYIALLLDDITRKVELRKYSCLNDVDLDGLVEQFSVLRTRLPRVTLTGGLRTTREADYLFGHGPQLVLPEGDHPHTIKHLDSGESIYEPVQALGGWWLAQIGPARTRFSINAPAPKAVPLPTRVFDLATFSYSRTEPAIAAGFFAAPRPLPKPIIDLLAGTDVMEVEAPEATFAPTLPGGHAITLVEQLPPIDRTTDEPIHHSNEILKEEESVVLVQLPPTGLLRSFPVHVSNWVGTPLGCVEQIGDMLQACYPESREGLKEDLYKALDQLKPLVVADVAQVVALAKTTGSAITHVSLPMHATSQVNDLHQTLIRHAIKDARRYGGEANRFVFAVVDLTQSSQALACMDAIASRYGICQEKPMPGETELPPNLYLTFVLNSEARQYLRRYTNDHCPVCFVNGGWGQPVHGALKLYMPSCFFQKTSTHG